MPAVQLDELGRRQAASFPQPPHGAQPPVDEHKRDSPAERPARRRHRGPER